MAYTLDKKWKSQTNSQMTTAIAFAENEEEFGFNMSTRNSTPVFSIDDIFLRKSQLAMSLLSLEEPEFLECLETTNIITTS